MNQCQAVAGLMISGDPLAVIDAIRLIVRGVRPSLSVRERLVACSVINQLLGRVAKWARIDTDPLVAQSFVEIGPATSSLQAWQRAVDRLLDTAEAAWRNQVGALAQANTASTDPRPAAFIDAHYADSALTLGDVSTNLRLSLRQTRRILNQQPGSGFTVSVRQRRVIAAKALLQYSSLSMKEIATAVGFGHATLFSRHFKAMCGVTPTAFRRDARKTVP